MEVAAAYPIMDRVAAEISASLVTDRPIECNERSAVSCCRAQRGMIMNKVVAILTFVVVTGYTTPDASWAHRHILVPPEGERRPLVPPRHDGFIGPVLRSEGLSKRAEQPIWDGINLTHPDPHHHPGSEPSHSTIYRNNHAPDGAPVIFGWPTESLLSFHAIHKAGR